MNVTPNDLDLLIAQLPDHDHWGWPHAGVVAAALRICDGLQPDIVWADGDNTRADWLANLEDTRFWVGRSSSGNARDVLKAKTLKSLATIAARTWRGPGTKLFQRLPFMRDPALRSIVERDLSSLAAARKSDEIKVALVLAGCVIECLLTDVLEHSVANSESAARAHPEFGRWGKNFDAKTPTDWTFIRKIDVCGPKGLQILSDKTEAIAHQVRDWRNLVHPHLERDDMRASPLRPSDAAVAEGLVLKIIDEVADWRSQNP